MGNIIILPKRVKSQKNAFYPLETVHEAPDRPDSLSDLGPRPGIIFEKLFSQFESKDKKPKAAFTRFGACSVEVSHLTILTMRHNLCPMNYIAFTSCKLQL